MRTIHVPVTESLTGASIAVDKDGDGDLLIRRCIGAKVDTFFLAPSNVVALVNAIRAEFPELFPAVAPAAPKARPSGPQAYRGNGSHSWEHVAYDVRRLRVPGGWLYKPQSSGACFVPVPSVVGYGI